MISNDLGHISMEISPERVQKVLVGFISEISVPSMTSFDSNRVKLAHSSVLEFLMDKNANDQPFTVLDQHTEAAMLCLSRISYSVHRRTEQCSNNVWALDDNRRRSHANFLYYSWQYWPRHCRRAFDENGECPLVQATKDFLLRDWGEISDQFLLPGSPLSQNMWHFAPLVQPGFVICGSNLIELLEFPEIQALINFQDVNGRYDTVIDHALEFAHPSTISRIVQLFPQQVKVNERGNTLINAIQRGNLDLLERLLANGADVHTYLEQPGIYTDGQSIMYQIVSRSGFFWRYDIKHREEVQKVVQVLLKYGANLYETNHIGQSVMHLAANDSESRLLRLFVKHAIHLEGNGLLGSVQRLLRLRDDYGRTPRDYTTESDAVYLEEVLEEFEKANNMIMFDLDYFKTVDLTIDGIKEDDVMEYLRNVLYAFQIPPRQREEVSAATVKYRKWLTDMRRMYEEQYKATERRVGKI
jgi:ankyrin repeat protein